MSFFRQCKQLLQVCVEGGGEGEGEELGKEEEREGGEMEEGEGKEGGGEMEEGEGKEGGGEMEEGEGKEGGEREGAREGEGGEGVVICLSNHKRDGVISLVHVERKLATHEQIVSISQVCVCVCVCLYL